MSVVTLGNGKRALNPNTPHYAIIATVILVIVGIVGAVVAEDDRAFTILIGLIVTTVPSLLAAGFAERASRDIRNGTVTEKAREGAQKALDDTGVTDGATATPALVRALTQLLDERETSDIRKARLSDILRTSDTDEPGKDIP